MITGNYIYVPGQPICGSKQGRQYGKSENIKAVDIENDKSVRGGQKVTCPECIQILKKAGV